VLSKLLFGIAALLLIGGPVIGLAQGKSQTGGLDAFIQHWDSDHDGTLSLDEVKKAADARFEALDRDHDGTLERKELGGAVTAKEFAESDADKDRTLDKKEYETLVEKRFRAADRDHDGTLDKKELSSRAGKALLRLLH